MYREDLLNDKGLRIYQDREGFCFGMDAVLLASFSMVKKGEEVLDLGTGTGIIPLLLCDKTEGKHFTGLEIQAPSVEMASQSVAANNLEDKITIIQGDIRQATEMFGKGRFDVVTANPPYIPYGGGLINPKDKKAIARHELYCTLEDVVRAAAELLKDGGRFYMVHKPSRLTEIFGVFATYRVKPRFLRMVHPQAEADANMVLIEGIRRGNNELCVESPCIINGPDGHYTKEVHDIYFNEQRMKHRLGGREING